ncbi:MAG: magnesium/cobalt transporter CorA [Spirochaeta sp.]
MMQKLVQRHKKPVGAAPGTMIYTGSPSDAPVRICVTAYNEEAITERWIEASEVLKLGSVDRGAAENVCWVHVNGVHDADIVRTVGTEVNLHPLTMEDILSTDQRPKLEMYSNHLFMALRALRWDDTQQQIVGEQISLILTPTQVISFSESDDSIFDEVRRRLQSGRRVRFMGADYLMYALMDAVVDAYFVVLERLGDRIEELENELMHNPEPDVLSRLHGAKREALLMRKALWPLREVVSSLSRDTSILIKAETQLFFRDVYDHTIHVLDTVETLRDLLMGLLDLYVSGVSNRMNEVMKVLTIIATIFMPLTFIAGVYGMNFENMPELSWQWGYPVVMLSMAVIGVGLAVYFKLKKWL